MKMFDVITIAYLLFWGPLFLVTLVNWDWKVKRPKSQWHIRSLFMWLLFIHLLTLPYSWCCTRESDRSGDFTLIGNSILICSRLLVTWSAAPGDHSATQLGLGGNIPAEDLDSRSSLRRIKHFCKISCFI